MRREIAEAMMQHSLALGPDMNALSELSEGLQGEERAFIRGLLGDMMAANAGIVLAISRAHPDLDPDDGAS